MEVRAQPSSVCVNRENPAQVLVCFEEGPPELLDIYKGTSRPVPCVPVGQTPPNTPPSFNPSVFRSMAAYSMQCTHLQLNRCMADSHGKAHCAFLMVCKASRTDGLKCADATEKVVCKGEGQLTGLTCPCRQ